MKPDFDRAAVKATETLIEYGITTAPVDPMRILKTMPDVLMVSYTEIATAMDIDRSSAVTMFGHANQDAVTAYLKGRNQYFIAYNQRLPFYMLQRAFARELGHIVLGHDGTRPEDVRNNEALCFARHFLCPRGLLKAVEESGLPFTVELLGAMTGCYERALIGIR